MTKCIRNMLMCVCMMTMVLQLGCQGEKQSAISARGDAADVSPSSDPKPTGRDKRFATAEEAKDALFTAPSGRLMEVMQAQGPVAAINVCSQEADKISRRVGKEYGVAIGRTSFKLRNPANAPRQWVEPFIQQRVDTPQQVSLDNGNLGVLFPIRLDVKCLMCHGGPNDILDDVKPKLASLYPEDQATGFKQGDLRGWFWVEVPDTI